VLSGPLTGRLLVAAPPLVDPNFDRTVVFVLEHGQEGALGVVLNRPTETMASDALPLWAGAVAEPAVIFAGGPVDLDAVIGVAAGGSSKTESYAPVAGGVGTVDLRAEPDGVEPEVHRLRLFAGYAGWSAGQLEEELAVGAWIIADADPSDPFTDQPDELWRAVLRRQRGRTSWLALYPDDISSN
jgi:putative transcriptional regulator